MPRDGGGRWSEGHGRWRTFYAEQGSGQRGDDVALQPRASEPWAPARQRGLRNCGAKDILATWAALCWPIPPPSTEAAVAGPLRGCLAGSRTSLGCRLQRCSPSHLIGSNASLIAPRRSIHAAPHASTFGSLRSAVLSMTAPSACGGDSLTIVTYSCEKSHV
jgi:hypothetical protein